MNVKFEIYFSFDNRDNYETYQNQYSITIYPSSWFEIVDQSRLNLINNNQFLFPEHYGEHTLDKRMTNQQLISHLQVNKKNNNNFSIDSLFLLENLW
mgnify:CR=1 FL=1